MSNKYAIASYVNTIPAWKPRPDFEEPGPNQNKPMLLAQLRPACSLTPSDHNTEDTTGDPRSMVYLSLPTSTQWKLDNIHLERLEKTHSDVTRLHHTWNKANAPPRPLFTDLTDNFSLSPCIVYQLILHLGSKLSGQRGLLCVSLLDHLAQRCSGSRPGLPDIATNNH